jgi:hypothetical protein
MAWGPELADHCSRPQIMSAARTLLHKRNSPAGEATSMEQRHLPVSGSLEVSENRTKRINKSRTMQNRTDSMHTYNTCISQTGAVEELKVKVVQFSSCSISSVDCTGQLSC